MPPDKRGPAFERKPSLILNPLLEPCFKSHVTFAYTHDVEHLYSLISIESATVGPWHIFTAATAQVWGIRTSLHAHRLCYWHFNDVVNASIDDVVKIICMVDMNEQDVVKMPNKAEPSIASTKPALDHEVPDPNEDDLDDLDELLDDFSTFTAKGQGGPVQQSLQHDFAGERKPSITADNDFEKQLQEQMAALMDSANESPEVQKEIRGMLQELSAAVDFNAAQNHPMSLGSQLDPPAGMDKSFEEAIQRTMQRIQASSDQATAAAAADQEPEDLLAQMLKEIRRDSSGDTGRGEDISNMLMAMMEQLTNKDILYDPMKELNDKFPVWMSTNRRSAIPEDSARYEKQQRLVAEIVGKFEESTYSDTNTKDREYIVERMQEVPGQLDNS
ncbi:MAG: hypothetical protein Q9206_005785 [Seirophora lacunosa]